MQMVEETKAKKRKADDVVEPVSLERTAPATTTATDVAPGFRAPLLPATDGQPPPPAQGQAQPNTQAATDQDAVHTEAARTSTRKAEANARVKKLREDTVANATQRLADAAAEHGIAPKQPAAKGTDCTS